MAKGFDVLHVKSAVRSRNKFDLSRSHLTTMNFGEIVPLFVEETIPGDDIKVKSDFFLGWRLLLSLLMASLVLIL